MDGGNGGFEKPEHIPQDIWDKAGIAKTTLCMILEVDCPRRTHAIRQSIASAMLAERELAGGARAARFNGSLIIAHPEMPPHVWDGDRLKPLAA